MIYCYSSDHDIVVDYATVHACLSSVVAVSEILAADRQLAEEIEFDLKRFEEERKKITQPETPLSATPHAQMVHQIESNSIDSALSESIASCIIRIKCSPPSILPTTPTHPPTTQPSPPPPKPLPRSHLYSPLEL